MKGIGTNDLKRELEAVRKKEQKYLNRHFRKNPLKEKLYEKVPEKLQGILEKAFEKAFWLVFEKGTGVIEKTFDRESALLEFEAGDYVLERRPGRKSIRRMEKKAGKDNGLNTAAAAVSGLGLGLLGLGIPDIPLVTGTLLKGIYEIALGYGFSYEEPGERIYILRLIRCALSEDETRVYWSQAMDEMAPGGQLLAGVWGQEDTAREIALTAKALSDGLLVEKFIQGIPLVGAVGGAVNAALYGRVSKLAGIKYKKRYLEIKNH